LTTFFPKISIVTPSFNQGDFIEETILSVLNQNYPNLEYIIIDGGSTDQTVEIIKKYESKLTYWVSEPDNGQGNAINKGFRKATGDLFGWINSDDYYTPNSFLKLAEAFNPNYEFYYGDYLEINQGHTSYSDAKFVADSFLRFGGLIASHSAFWSKTIHQEIWEEMKCNIDGELWIRMLKGKKKKYIRYPLGVYRHQTESKSSNDKWEKAWRMDDLLIEKRHGAPPKAKSYSRVKYILFSKVYQFIQKFRKRPSPWNN
jgi:glycosyltransferase involved in cell wall biosynthesis